MRTLCLIIALLTFAAAPCAIAVEPDEVLSDAALEARAPRAVQGIALHGVPEPVDRRFGGAARARFAHSRA